LFLLIKNQKSRKLVKSMKINEKLFCRNNFSLKIIEKYLFNINSLIVIDFGRYKIELMFV